MCGKLGYIIMKGNRKVSRNNGEEEEASLSARGCAGPV